MSQSILNSSLRQASNMELEKKDAQMIPLYSGNKLNPSLKSILRSIKNNFGVVTCVGSEQFYVFTRQMLLHMDFNKALNLTEEQYDDIDFYKSEQFERENNCIDVNSPKRLRKPPKLADDMDTSFAKVESNDIKKMLETDLVEIQSDYELSHNQLAQKELQTVQFKKSYSSSVAPEVSPSFKTKSRESLLIKNKQIILNEVDLLDESLSQNNNAYDRPSPIQKTRSVKFIDESFHNDVENFKQSMEKKKIEEIMRKRGCTKVLKNGEEMFVHKNDFLRLYNSKEIGTDKEKRPIEWIYSEVKSLSQQAIQTAYLLSSTIVYELPFTKEPTIDQFDTEIKEYLQFYRRIESEINKFDDTNTDMPEIVIVCPIEDSEQAQNVKSSFRTVFNQLESFIIPQAPSKKNLNYFQSPFSQFHKLNSPIKSKLPPTPKRMLPVSHRNSQASNPGTKKKVRLEFRMISQELSKSGVLRQNYSRMREITTQGRQIFNQQSLKTLCGNLVSSGCYVSLLERVSDQVPSIQIEQFYENWEGVYEEFVKSAMEDAASKYEEKVNELIVGKTIISQSRLTQIHEVAKKQTLRQFSQKKIGSSRVLIESNKQIKSGAKIASQENSIANSRRISISRGLVESRKQLSFNYPDSEEPEYLQEELINLVESRIEEQKQQLASKTKGEALKWCRKFLSSEYEQVKKKLLSNEIKSILNFRQQLEFLKETYKKKLENHSALEYEMMEEFNCFMMESLFAGIEVLNEKERSDWKEKVKRQCKNVEDLEIQIKELKRSLLSKERSLSEQKAQLENKLEELTSTIENLSSQLEVKTKEINYLKTEYEEQFNEKQAEHNKKIQSLKKQCDSIKKQTDSKGSDIVYLQSELQKEQLLHQQTHSNYEQILITYKNNVSQLEKKVKQLKESSNLAQEQLKNSINKDEIDNEITKFKKQSQQKIEALEKQLEEKIKMINEQAEEMNQKLQESVQASKLLQTQKDQIEITYKLNQQKMIELESRMERYKNNEADIEKYQQQIDQLTNEIQSSQNEKAILEQKLTLSTQESQETITKISQSLNMEIDSLKQEISEITFKNQTYRKKLYPPKAQVEVQTTFTVEKSQEITIKAKCKHCKENKIRLNEAMKIAQFLDEKYKNLKSAFLTNKCLHCTDSQVLLNNSTYKTTVHS